MGRPSVHRARMAFKSGRGHARPVEPSLQQGRAGGGRDPAQITDAAASRIERHYPPHPQQGSSRAAQLARRRRLKARRRRVGFVVARQQHQSEVSVRRPRRQLLDTVRPVAAPTQQPHDHQPRTGQCRVGVKVDGIVVRQLQEVRAPQGRHVWVVGEPCPLGTCDQRQFGVRSGEKDDVSRRLAQVDRLATIVDRPSLCDEQMHALSPPTGQKGRRRVPSTRHGSGARGNRSA